jgi:hypothetical protein
MGEVGSSAVIEGFDTAATATILKWTFGTA